MWDTRVRSVGGEDPLEKEMATHSTILAWRVPWMEKPCKLQSIGQLVHLLEPKITQEESKFLNNVIGKNKSDSALGLFL